MMEGCCKTNLKVDYSKNKKNKTVFNSMHGHIALRVSIEINGIFELYMYLIILYYAQYK